MLSLLLLYAPGRLGRERALTGLLLACMIAAITIQLVLCVQARRADHSLRLRDGSEIVLVDPGEATAKPGLTTTRVKLADATLHGASPSSERIAFVDPAFPWVFGIASCRGSVGHALARGDELVLTASTARRLFAGADPIGRSLVMSVGDEAMALRVGAVACDAPSLPQMRYAMLATLGPFLLGQGAAADIQTYRRLSSPSGGLASVRAAMGGLRASPNPLAGGTARTAGGIAFLVVLLQGLGWSFARLVPRGREAALYRGWDGTPARLAAAMLLDPVLLVASAGLIGVGLTEWWFGGTLPYGGADGVLATLAARSAVLLCALAVAPIVVALGGRRLGARVAVPTRAALLVAQLGLAVTLLAAGGALLALLAGAGGGRGHEPARVLVIGSLADPAINAAQRQSLLASIAGLEGVSAVGVATRLFGPDLPRATVAHGRQRVAVPFAQVDPGALPTLRAQTLAGRLGVPGIVLTADTARRLGFGTPAAAIGARLAGPHSGTVRAVVRDLRFGPDGAGSSPALFEVVPAAPSTGSALVRAVDPARATAAIRAAWRAAAPGVPFDAMPLRDVERIAWAGDRDAAGPLAAAMLLAFLSALAGTWGVTAGIGGRRAAARAAGCVVPGVVLAGVLLRLPPIRSAFGAGEVASYPFAAAVAIVLLGAGLVAVLDGNRRGRRPG